MAIARNSEPAPLTSGIEINEEQRKLFVFIPDSTGRTEPLTPLIELLHQQPELRGVDFLDIPYTMAWSSNRELSAIAHDISAKIEEHYTEHRPKVSEIVLCGFSLGATLARRAYLDANGYGQPEGQKQLWAGGVKRIVLMGAICRGFNLRRLPLHHRLALRAAWLLGLGRALRSASGASHL